MPISREEKRRLKLAAEALDDVELDSALRAALRHDFEIVEIRIERGFKRASRSLHLQILHSWRDTDWIFGRRPDPEEE